MTTRTAARLAWSLCAGCVAGIGGLLVLKVLNGGADLRSAPLVVAPLAFLVVGALVAARQQRNPVGWQLLAVGVFMTANLLGESYARYALITAPGSLPGGLYGPWLGWTYAPIVTILAVFLPLYFPTGRLLSPRWRPVVWFGMGFLDFAVAGNALWPGPEPPLLGLAPVPNPVVYLPQAKPLFELFRNLAGLCLLPGIAGAIAALVVRFRRSRGIERQQLKWFTYAAALAPLPGFVYEAAPSIFGLLRTLIFPLVPISVGVAILRYRLYEIDRILNHPGLWVAHRGPGLVLYGWIAGVCAGGRYRRGPAELAGRRRNPGRGGDLPTGSAAYPGRGGSTLQPPKVQRRQDHPDVLHRLRDQVDLDTLSSELLAVVDQTTRSLLKMPGPVRAEVLCDSAGGGRPARSAAVSGWPSRCTGQRRAGQASTQTPSRRARPSISSRRRLTAGTRNDHHSWLRSTRGRAPAGSRRRPARRSIAPPSAASAGSSPGTFGSPRGGGRRAARPRGGEGGWCGHPWRWCSADAADTPGSDGRS
jgi:hypothetical protein